MNGDFIYPELRYQKTAIFAKYFQKSYHNMEEVQTLDLARIFLWDPNLSSDFLIVYLVIHSKIASQIMVAFAAHHIAFSYCSGDNDSEWLSLTTS